MSNKLVINDLNISVDEASLLLGVNEKHLQLLELSYEVKILFRNNEFIILEGDENKLKEIKAIIKTLLSLIRKGIKIDERDVMQAVTLCKNNQLDQLTNLHTYVICKNFQGKNISPKTLGQLWYARSLAKNDIVFGIGPAGTGKTFLAVAHAVDCLKKNIVKKIILTRPAVEAGENLGFLPGDLKEKVDPYLRPLYDSLDLLIGQETTEKLMARGVIEIAPLAYMRGRTLEDAYVILDEAQNTTSPQLKMFLTRLGFNSKMAITGDITQIDLKSFQKSSLIDAQKVLGHIDGISFIKLSSKDVIRHPLVQNIIDAYSSIE